MSDRWQRMQAVFNEAVALPDGERGAYLRAACAGDEALQAEVRRLLEHDEGTIDEPASAESPAEDQALVRSAHKRTAEGGCATSNVTRAKDDDPLIGVAVAGYQIKRIIASGGMGSVYLAEQAHPRRDVALKLMQSHLAARGVQKRFEHEAEFLARLRHPNIAQVYEAGTAMVAVDGGAPRLTPFFAMEFVPGARSIVDYAEETELPILARLELFATACDAVHHGHQRSIVHRDLKPGNILVDERGAVKVIDFGVARAIDSDVAVTSMQTEIGQLIGTLAYMSPEQCAADPREIHTHSDVYSLGVVLYELLTGRLPYELCGLTIHAAMRVISEQPPAFPAVADSALHRNLRAIVLKALEKDRARRYASAEALAGDIRCHLRGDPISARPPTRWNRAARWIGRHPVAATMALCAAIMSAAAGASAAAIYFYNRTPYGIVQRLNGIALKGEEIDRILADEAALVSRSGLTLNRWGDGPESITFAKRVDEPAEFGGRRLVIIGFTPEHRGPEARQLCAFDVDGDPQRQVWVCGVEDGEVISPLREYRRYTRSMFWIRHGLVADIFTDDAHPGPEVVAVYATPTSHRAIRIYDLRGKLLYQVWHDGTVGPPVWLESPGLLVFAGDNHLYSFDRFGEPIGEAIKPCVVFAVRPRIDYINTTDYLPAVRGEGPNQPAWYRCLRQGAGVPRQSGECVASVRLCRLVSEPDCISLLIQFQRGLGHAISFTLDADGNEHSTPRVVGEQYKSAPAAAGLPDPNDLFIGDFVNPNAAATQPAAGQS